MEEFKPTKFNLSAINNGKGKYINGVDSVQADTINAVVEGAAWVQALGTNQPNNSEADNVGTPSVSIETLSDGTPRFKFDNLKGENVKSPVETGAFLSGQNTLKDAQSSFTVESNNRFDYDSITPEMDYGSFSKIQGGYFVQGADGGDFDVSYGNGWLVFNMSLSKGDIISFDYEVLSLMKPEWNRFTVTINPMNISQSKSNLSVGSSGRFIWEIPEDGGNEWVFRVGGLGVNITNICISKVTDTYTPFLADGTSVTVRKANKNLAYFNNGTAAIMSVSDNIFTINGQSSTNYGLTKGIYLGKGTYTITCEYVSGTTAGNVWIRVGTTDNAKKYCSFSTSDIVTNKIEGKTFTISESESCLVRIYGHTSIEYNQFKFKIQLEVSDTYTGYEKPVYEDITTAVGQSVNITQYDNITNLSVLTEGGSLSGQFILSTQYELNDKLTPLFGTFASRPTTTQPYAILYIATDQTGENKVTILPANTDGSVSGNWISI